MQRAPGSIRLHQRCDGFQENANRLTAEFHLACGLAGYLGALRKGLPEILLNLRDTGNLPQIGGTLKMMIKAPVIHIYGAYHSFPVIADEHLGVDKARSILIDFDPRIQQ